MTGFFVRIIIWDNKTFPKQKIPEENFPGDSNISFL